MKRKLFIMIGIATLHVLLGMSTAGAASIGFSPQNSTATVGGSFSVDIVAQGFVELAGGTIDFSYDNTLVEVSSVSIDPYWDFLPDPGSNIAAGEWSNIGFDVFVNTPISGDAVKRSGHIFHPP